MKSLIATVAVSMALSAVATDTGYISGTSFEGISLGEKSSVELVKGANDSGVVDNVRYWCTDAWETENSADYEGFFVVTNISSDTSYPESRPEHWANAENNQALVIDTDKPLYRRVNPIFSGGNSEFGANSELITLNADGVFFDSVVQFTATDVPLEPGDKDKLLVWLYSSPEDVTETNSGLFKETTPITNLVVTAGYYKENDNTLYTTNYCVAADNISIKPDEWHRLTIKAFISNDGKHALFNVYVDGTKVKTEDGEDGTSDFISLKDDSASIATITGVAFDGKGMVDDIAFTTTAPDFANEGDSGESDAQYVLTLDLADGVSVYSFEIGTESQNVASGSSYNVPVGTTVSLVLNAPPSGYKYVFEGATFIENEFGGYACDFMPNEAGYGTIKIMLVASGSADMPTIDGVPVTNNDFSAANSGSAIKVPTTWTMAGNTLKNGNTEVYTFKSYYDVALEGGTVTLTLNDNAKPTISETAIDEGDAIVVTDDAVALGVTNAIPGLWYGAQAYDDVACAEANKIGEEATGWVQAESGKTTVVVTVEKPKKLTVVVDKAFFRVVVDDQDHSTATPPAEQN